MNARLLAFVLVLCAAFPARAETVDAVLADQNRRGYATPVAAVERLLRAEDAPGPASPVPLKERYWEAVGQHAASVGVPRMRALAERAALELDTLSATGQCRRCHAQALLVRARRAITGRALDDADELLSQAARELRTEDMAQRSRLHQMRARVLNMRGNFPRAIAEAVAALELADRLRNTPDRTAILCTMVAINASLGDFRRGEALATKAEGLARMSGFRYGLAQLRLNQAYLYLRSGRRELQREYLTQALALASGDAAMADIEVISLSNLADYWLNMGDNAKALEFARRAATIARASADDRSLMYATTNEGIALANLGQVEQGIERIRAAAGMASRLGAKNDRVGITEELVQVYARAGRYREAFEATQEVAALNRELTRQEREKTAQEIQEKYAADSREREIERLSAANRLKQAQMDAQKWRQGLAAVVAVLLGVLTILLVRWLKNARRANRKLSGDIAVLAQQSVHDPLTGVFNRRHCQQLMAQHESRVGRGLRSEAGSVGLMLLDIDFFKKVNDTHGHAAGDQVLVEVARRLRGLVRLQDAVVRWGGEEFVLVLPGTSAQGTATLAERVLHAIAEMPVVTSGSVVPVTVSIGATVYPLAPGAQWEDALHVADMALYLSKAGGRNRASCVMAVRDDAALALAGQDLAAAARSGGVELLVVTGPEREETAQAPHREHAALA